MNSKTPSLFAAIVAVSILISPAPARGQAAVGPEHTMMKKLVGTWTAKVNMDGEVTEGTATYKAIGDGLWLISDFKGTMAGQPFEGHGIDGYDPAKGKYVSIWVDSWTPQPLTLEGTYDKASHKLTMMGSGPGMDGQTVKYRMVTHYENDDRFTFTMFRTDASGQENQMLTIVYSRKK